MVTYGDQKSVAYQNNTLLGLEVLQCFIGGCEAHSEKCELHRYRKKLLCKFFTPVEVRLEVDVVDEHLGGLV